MFGMHHQFKGYKFEQTLEIVEGRGDWCAAVHGVTVRHNFRTEEQ